MDRVESEIEDVLMSITLLEDNFDELRLQQKHIIENIQEIQERERRRLNPINTDRRHISGMCRSCVR